MDGISISANYNGSVNVFQQLMQGYNRKPKFSRHVYKSLNDEPKQNHMHISKYDAHSNSTAKKIPVVFNALWTAWIAEDLYVFKRNIDRDGHLPVLHS